ncbi:hypothetical protein NDN08_001060 [Rhodosorus marinus]|uniref:Uncharacterized protein n=1 Tax=Rhodosorus marinus TaxID=101924 RepID=A0AAV8UTT9_9RHOD|nr:hypothetical protein NDN08_001060 [Rhodosorus marinus]
MPSEGGKGERGSEKNGGRKLGVVGGKLKLKNVKKERERALRKAKRELNEEQQVDERVKKKSDRYCQQT